MLKKFNTFECCHGGTLGAFPFDHFSACTTRADRARRPAGYVEREGGVDKAGDMWHSVIGSLDFYHINT
jgi:hypothetical protein